MKYIIGFLLLFGGCSLATTGRYKHQQAVPAEKVQHSTVNKKN